MRRDGAVGGVRAVLLDIDDTLLDTRSAFRAAVAHVLSTWLPHLDAAQREAAALHWVRDPGGHFRAYTRGEHSFDAQRRLRAADLHNTFGGPTLDEATYARWADGYERTFQGAWRLLPDAAPLLARLAAEGLPVGTVTNMETPYQRAKLDAVGLGELPVLVGVDDLGRGKPDPAVFHLACERIGVSPAEAAYIGDELDVDARGARDAGLLGVWLNRHGERRLPSDVPVVRTLSQVPDVLGLDET